MIIKHCYSIVAEPNEYYVSYTIYEHDGWTEGGTPLFHRKDSSSYPDPIEDYKDAEPMFKGTVKWDGCSNWDFSSQEMNMFHGCCKKDLVNVGLIMGEAWDMTKDLIPEKWYTHENLSSFKFHTASFTENEVPVELKDFNPRYIPGNMTCSFSCSVVSGPTTPYGEVIEGTYCNGTYLLLYENESLIRIDEKYTYGEEDETELS